ncbi:Ig-like domain-containing protein, partial [Methylocucumis oryzae]
LTGTGVSGSGALASLSGDNSLSGAVTLTGNTRISVNTGSLTLSGIISDGANVFNLSKTGAGTLILSNTESYDGSTTVSAGTLLINGSISGTGSVSVASSAILGGTGYVAGAVTLSSSATIAPGINSAGLLTLNSDFTGASGAVLAVDLNGTTAGTNYDQIAVGGALDLNGLTATFNLGFTPIVGDSFTLINKTSSGAITGTLNGLAEGATFNASGVMFSISYIGGTGNDLVITVADVTRPTLSSFSVSDSDGRYKVGDTLTIVATMDEAVTAGSTFAVTLDTGVTINLTAATNGTTLTGNYTVSLNEASNDLTVSSYTTGTVTDLANNALTSTTLPSGNNIADTKNIIIDGVLPTAVISVSDTALKVGDMATVTFTFSEAVTNFTTTDVNVANGVLTNLITSDSGITWTATLTPDSNLTDTSNTLTLDLTGINDLAGNSGVGSANSGNYTLDTTRPTASIVVVDSALTIGDTSLVTITFSEAVNGFTNTDLTVENGSLSNVSSNDSGITWTATLTPDSNVTDTTNTLTLDLTGISDLAGNSGVG